MDDVVLNAQLELLDDAHPGGLLDQPRVAVQPVGRRGHAQQLPLAFEADDGFDGQPALGAALAGDGHAGHHDLPLELEHGRLVGGGEEGALELAAFLPDPDNLGVERGRQPPLGIAADAPTVRLDVGQEAARDTVAAEVGDGDLDGRRPHHRLGQDHVPAVRLVAERELLARRDRLEGRNREDRRLVQEQAVRAELDGVGLLAAEREAANAGDRGQANRRLGQQGVRRDIERVHGTVGAGGADGTALDVDDGLDRPRRVQCQCEVHRGR